VHSSKIEGIPLLFCTDMDGRYPYYFVDKKHCRVMEFQYSKRAFLRKRDIFQDMEQRQ
jgi:hypothetical protein